MCSEELGCGLTALSLPPCHRRLVAEAGRREACRTAVLAVLVDIVGSIKLLGSQIVPE
jgi:hypothetical protein